jgi:hypothetical protein
MTVIVYQTLGSAWELVFGLYMEKDTANLGWQIRRRPNRQKHHRKLSNFIYTHFLCLSFSFTHGPRTCRSQSTTQTLSEIDLEFSSSSSSIFFFLLAHPFWILAHTYLEICVWKTVGRTACHRPTRPSPSCVLWGASIMINRTLIPTR